MNKNNPLMVIHHHTKFHSSLSIQLRDTGFPDFDLTLDQWPWPFRETLHEHKMIHSWLNTIIPKFIQLVHPLQKYRPKQGFQDFHAICDLWPWPFRWTLTNKKWRTHNNIPLYQHSFQSVHLNLRYRPKHGFQVSYVTFDLWPWLFRWTLPEQKIFHSWKYTIIPKFSPIGPFDSEIEARTWFQGQLYDLWPMTLII